MGNFQLIKAKLLLSCMFFFIFINRRLDFIDEENYEDFGEVDDIELDMFDLLQNRLVY